MPDPFDWNRLRPLHGVAHYRRTIDDEPNGGVPYRFLKIKGEPAWWIFANLIGDSATSDGGAFLQSKRRGVHLLGSTRNVQDPVVIEVRLAGAGQITPRGEPASDWDLFHSMTVKRHEGRCTLQDGRLTFTGAVNAHLALDVTGDAGGEVALVLTDPIQGRVRWA